MIENFMLKLLCKVFKKKKEFIKGATFCDTVICVLIYKAK